MNTQRTADRADDALRALLADVDPETGATTDVPEHLLDRVLAASAGGHAAHLDAPTSNIVHRSFGQRHWQVILMAAAGVATLALAAGTVLPGLSASSSDTLADASASGAAPVAGAAELQHSDGQSQALAKADELEGTLVAPDADRSAGSAADAAAPAQAPSTGLPSADAVDEALVRSGSVLVGTDDAPAARNAFVATILARGGRITSESVVTDGSAGARAGATTASTDIAAAPIMGDLGISYPYPWYPTGPGIWLTVQVPVEAYDEAMAAARSAGEVVQMQQSSYDVGAQVADVDARIAALESSIARLTALMDDATDISDVIELEQAISQRQSELDGLKAQQRDLANQTAMSQISLTLMSPEDAQQSVGPQPEQSWWESFVDALGEFWGWLGRALLIVSPLLIAMGIIWWVRRRGRGPATTASAGMASAEATAPSEAAPRAD